MDMFQIIRLNDEKNFFANIGNVDINILNEYGQNLLHEAISSNNTLLGLELLKKKINLNCQDKNGQTPLHFAAVYSNTELAKMIVDNGGSLLIKDNYGNNPVWSAVFNAKGKNYEIVELFLKSGGDAFSKNKNNKSPYDFAVQINDEKIMKMIKIYL